MKAESAEVGTPVVEPRRWGAELKPVVNTSLPAQLAPKLVPVTLASATASSVPLAPIRKRIHAPSMDDFPSLGGSRVQAPVVPKTSFVELSRNWAEKQKADKEAIIRMEEEKRMLEQAELRLQERAAKEAQELLKVRITGIIRPKKGDSDDEKYIEDNKRPLSDEPYVSDEPSDEPIDDDEEEEFVNDGSWNSRKHRDELY